MASHKAQSQFDRAKWRLRILIPLWAFQLALTVFMSFLFSWRLGETMKHWDKQQRGGELPTIELVWEVTNIGLSSVASICTIVEIFKFFSESLTPWTMLFTQVIKLTCAGAILALDAVIYVQRHDRHYSLLGLGVDAVFILTALALVIYALVIYRRLSAYDDYAHPANIKGFGFNDDVDRETSYQGKIDTIRASLEAARRSGVRASLEVVRPAVSRNSSGSFSSSERPQLQSIERNPSYSHRRDTQFDEYMARQGSLRLVVDDFSDLFPESPPYGAGNPLSPTGRTGRPHSASVSRHPSYGSERTLGAVLEVEEEEACRQHRHHRDSEGLLKPSRRNSDVSDMSDGETDLPHQIGENQAARV
ncbi:hypothetical protein B0I35DRAFT_476783 [Stachybotrys elegans]|uniref:Uncharacterized protein n=1 Tax=Stachybotrys elegans TaxID=80388 RepID=A0A8K0WUT5_9HYPO|nr:hypothetical protein B0I35DRAFT_476783 [Stachybotrys elegans]